VSQKHLKFPNLIEGLQVERINQVWQSDLTYLIIPKCGVFYLVFILDVYSRRILGFTANDHMRAEANVSCLSMAIKARAGTRIAGVIHHSDFGGQYGSDNYLNALAEIRAQVSMSKYAWKNAYAERINGIIKNDYLRHRKITSLRDLKYHLHRDVTAYNHERPHKALPKQMSPARFECYLHTLPSSQHPKFKIYDEKNMQKKWSGLPPTETIMETLFRFP
jgi:transposase InsO family protein